MIKAVTSAHFQATYPPYLLLPPSIFSRWDRRRANKASSYYAHSWRKYHYSAKSAKYLHDYILNYWFDVPLNYPCPGCYKIEGFIGPSHILCTKRIYTIMYPVGSFPSPTRIISSDIHHSIGGYYPCTPITRNEATNVNILYCHKHTKILISSSIHHNIQEATKIIYNNQLKGYESRLYWILSCEGIVYHMI